MLIRGRLTGKQQGLTSISMLAVLAVLGLLLTAAFKLGPLYLDNYFVRAAIQSLGSENLFEMTNADVRRRMNNTFTVNNIRDVNVKQMVVTREKKRILVSLNYEKRVNFMGNLDFVTVFVNEYDSSQTQ